MEAAAKKPKVGNDLTQGSIYKTLIVFAVPIILTNLIQQLDSMVDLMVIAYDSQLPGIHMAAWERSASQPAARLQTWSPLWRWGSLPPGKFTLRSLSVPGMSGAQKRRLVHCSALCWVFPPC